MATTSKASGKKTPDAKRKALSLHLGLNGVSVAAYAGWDGALAACEFDAHDMATLAASQAMKSAVLLTKKATRAALLAGLRASAKQLQTGDLFFLTYSGHGGQVPDINGDEADGKDETWCLYDGQLIDDELYFELSRFAAGVRILVLSDSCHSGTVTRDLPPPPPPPGQRAKLSAHATAVVGAFQPAVILIAGCQDNQTAMDGDHNGAFTEQLLKIWNQGAFKGNYSQFHARIRAGMPAVQTPNLFTLGSAVPFLAQEPFSV